MRQVLLALLICLFIGASSFVASWFIRGGRVYTVQTASMAPLFEPGDALLVATRSMPHIGQVASYRSLEHSGMIISHRIIVDDWQHQQLVTKGDANARADPLIARRQVLGQVTYIAPHLGTWIGRLRTPLGLALLVYLPALLTCGLILRSLLSTPGYQLRR